MRGAAWNIMRGWCSGDSFFYFQPWLVGLGHDTFAQVASNPDSLADVRRSMAWPAAPHQTGPTTNGPSGNSSTMSPDVPKISGHVKDLGSVPHAMMVTTQAAGMGHDRGSKR
jgi:Protein of unknown function (DUF4240)